MRDLQVVKAELLGHGFVDRSYLPDGEDEYYLRNSQSTKDAGYWRKLKPDEIERLVQNRNSADDWNDILVAEQFDPRLIANCQFHGLVRIGRLTDACLAHHELVIPIGITNSRIISCDIGDETAIHNVRYLSHYIIGNKVLLLNIDEMNTTNHAKFGNGIVKDGEDESVRVTLDLINEAGGRHVLPFDGMITADAALWAMDRHDTELANSLIAITQKQFDSRRGFYGMVGDQAVIKNSRIIKDVNVGPCAYVKGANKLKNLTINSSDESPTQIGEGVELVNGIIGFGCRVFYGVKAVRFVLGDNCSLKYGARLIHSVLGDNSTISCCEVLNNLVFGAHEQHHNNSFLIASLVMGQSNIGAGASIGSNHNSRAPDGEIHAGRGFWPGLCVTLKHNCRFASYTLLAKGNYPAELNIPLPFSLISNNVARNALQILPGYWWLYNMYALARNTWKFHARDKRKVKRQNIEFDSLAPDTIEEIFVALNLLALWTAKADLRARGEDPKATIEQEIIDAGHRLLTGAPKSVDKLEILAENVERSNRKVVILKAQSAYDAYRKMILYYAVKNLLDYCTNNPKATRSDMCDALGGERFRRWVNLGGQLVRRDDLDQLQADIKTGRLDDWNAIHLSYDKLWEKYPLDKQKHAFGSLLDLLGANELTDRLWQETLVRAVEIQEEIAAQTYISRRKDFDNPFRRMVYANDDEMRSVLGSAEDNSFVKQIRAETDQFVNLVESIKDRH